MGEHISEEQLIQSLYGLEIGKEHLAGCEDCRARLTLLESRRAELVATEDVSADFLAAQRRAVYSRMGERPRTFHAWIPAVASAALVAIGLYVYQPARRVLVAAPSETADAQLLSDILSMEQSAEPRAIEPIRGLFQESE